MNLRCMRIGCSPAGRMAPGSCPGMEYVKVSEVLRMYGTVSGRYEAIRHNSSRCPMAEGREDVVSSRCKATLGQQTLLTTRTTRGNVFERMLELTARS